MKARKKETIADFIARIKQKKELADVDSVLVKTVLSQWLKKNNLAVLPEKPSQQKIILKEVRAELRNYTGRFQKTVSYERRRELLKKGDIQALLKTHASTKERLSEYPECIDLVKQHNPSSILDLGCGLNPLAVASEVPSAAYYAIDIKEEELNLIKDYFKKQKISGKCIVGDVRTLSDLPEVDLCIAFKLLDILDTKGHKHATQVLQKIKAKTIIISFSTRTLSGKPMRSPRRQWFETLAHSQGFTFTTKRTHNEMFYILTKS